jgi:probable F420-dependent oxidoreductase
VAAARGIEPLGASVRAMGEIAAAAEQAGMSAWTPELHTRSATITLAEMASRTSTCTIGTAIAYGVGRSPIVLAAEARDLDELSDGRLVLGLGNGTSRMLEDWHGADPSSPASRMEELVPLLRRLWRLHEEPVRHDGRFYRVHIVPTGDVVPPVRERIPIWTAGANPRMIETAGRVADGLLAHPLCGPRYLREVARTAVEQGARHAGRDPGEVVFAALVIAVVHDDADHARREAAAQLAFYASAKTYGFVLDASGFGAEAAAVREAFARRDTEGMLAAITDQMVDELTVAGTPEEVRAGLARYDDLLDHLILYTPNFGMTSERAYENSYALIELSA